ncbi:hypothetical protein UF16_07515 [Chromobacterium violaceum]|nr:hypothetical protein UF16_07515 [Chromobacterium violaceum]
MLVRVIAAAYIRMHTGIDNFFTIVGIFVFVLDGIQREGFADFMRGDEMDAAFYSGRHAQVFGPIRVQLRPAHRGHSIKQAEKADFQGNSHAVVVELVNQPAIRIRSGFLIE